MRKGKRPATLVGIRPLLLRIAIMVSLVGLGGVLVKTGAVAQTTSPHVLTPAVTQRTYEVGERLNDSDTTDRQLPSGRPADGPTVFAKAQAGEIEFMSHEKTKFDRGGLLRELGWKN